MNDKIKIDDRFFIDDQFFKNVNELIGFCFDAIKLKSMINQIRTDTVKILNLVPPTNWAMITIKKLSC